MLKVLESPTMKLLLRELEFGASSTRDLVAVLGITRARVDAHIKAALAAGLIHVSGHERTKSCPARLFSIGPSTRPAVFKRLSNAEKCRRWRRSKREDAGKDALFKIRSPLGEG
jgi:DNA-binding MarR family transcriptional regulator